MDPYTATKYFYIRVQGNGTVTVVYEYGSGCTYGTEEKVTVKYYVVESISSVTLEQTVLPRSQQHPHTKSLRVSLTSV